MVLPAPGSGGVALRALGFPVRVDPFFVVVMGVLGFTAGAGVTGAAVFVSVAFVAVLLHELGHAVAARACGHSASIVLYGFGGATTHSGPPLGRARQALVSAAGPAVGLLAGLVVHLVRPALPEYGVGAFAVRAALFLTVGLGVLNLLPVLPLDGGHLLAALLPGDERTRRRRAAAVGLLVVVVGGVWALQRHQTLTVLLAAWLGWGNLAVLRERDPEPPARPSAPEDVERAAVSLVDAGRPDHAAHLLATSGSTVDPRVMWLVGAVGGDDGAWDRLVAEARAHPADPAAAACFVRAAVARGDYDELARVPLAGHGPLRAWAADRAAAAGRPDVAARLSAAV